MWRAYPGSISNILKPLLGLILFASSWVLAQQTTEPDAPRFDLTPLLGYRTSMSFEIEPHVSGTNPRVAFDANPSYGFAFGGHINDEDVLEFRWTRQDSHIHVENVPGINFRQRVTLDQFHFDATHEYFLDDWRKWARPFVMASLGATHLSASGSTNFTRFSLGIGGGVKFFTSRHFGLRVQAEWLPIVSDPDAAFVCGGGCIIHIRGDIVNQAEFVIGPMFRF